MIARSTLIPLLPFPLPPSSFPDAARSGTTVEFINSAREKSSQRQAACNESIKMARACVQTPVKKTCADVIARIRSMISWRWWDGIDDHGRKRATRNDSHVDLHVEWEWEGLEKFVPLAYLDSFVFMVKFYSGEKERKIFVFIFDYARIMKGKIDRVILFGFSFNL